MAGCPSRCTDLYPSDRDFSYVLMGKFPRTRGFPLLWLRTGENDHFSGWMLLIQSLQDNIQFCSLTQYGRTATLKARKLLLWGILALWITSKISGLKIWQPYLWSWKALKTLCLEWETRYEQHLRACLKAQARQFTGQHKAFISWYTEGTNA